MAHKPTESPSVPPPTVEDGGSRWKRRFDKRAGLGTGNTRGETSPSDLEQGDAPTKKPAKWSMGMLNDTETEEVPGSVLLLSEVSEFNEPLGLRNAPARVSASSLPSPYRTPSLRAGGGGGGSGSFSGRRRRRTIVPEKKRTPDGKIVLEPQPDDSLDDPLNWKMWRRDAALLSLGFYCMLGGGMTPILAAGFNNVADEFGVPVPRVALTTGLYMLGLGIGSVILSPTAILFGKRPVYLCAATCFILTAVWCALSPDFANLAVARVFMGVAVSSVECLPSASVAEIFFLHEKAYRLGIYTLLLLGGKNLLPLVSAVIIQSLGWRWVFWIVAIVVGFAMCLLFLFVPETFWDRTPRPHKHLHLHRLPSRRSLFRAGSFISSPTAMRRPSRPDRDPGQAAATTTPGKVEGTIAERRAANRRAHFQMDDEKELERSDSEGKQDEDEIERSRSRSDVVPGLAARSDVEAKPLSPQTSPPPMSAPDTIAHDYFSIPAAPVVPPEAKTSSTLSPSAEGHWAYDRSLANEKPQHYQHTEFLQNEPPKTFLQQLRPWPGRLTKDNWFRVALRPFVLFCYPSILWSTLVYSLSVGWLIVLSESVAHIYQNKASYNFDALQTGLVYISPFVGGCLGTAVAGKVSDVVVRYMARRNGGVYEPEFRLVMAAPVALFTTVGLMGFGWSAAERDRWIVPTVFFGFISFGCSLGSTTAITFAVDSYRQYAGEALVTLNFSKNVLHGFIFSLFFNTWLADDGSRLVFLAIGGIQLACLLTTIPMYIFGKRARMWSVRRDFLNDVKRV